ncbi:MAG TPA: PAS domain-containing protein [Bacillota bacterium]|nr:PAS domain-containing protein [Bacillota bacterium]
MKPKTSSLVFLNYLTTIFDNIADAIILIGVEPKGKYRLLLANDAFFASSGHTDDVIGREIVDIVHPDSYATLIKHYQRAVRTKRPVELTSWYIVPRGRRAFHIKLIPITNTVGDVVQIAGLNRDVTEILNLREEVRQLRAKQYKAKSTTP